MNIQEIVHFLKTGEDVDAQLESFEQLNKSATTKDLPELLQALQSADSGFWVRELISEPVLRIGGPKLLPEVLRALETNYKEGHDNDSLQGLLADFAEKHRLEVMKVLDLIEPETDGISAETIDWLFEYCEE